MRLSMHVVSTTDHPDQARRDAVRSHVATIRATGIQPMEAERLTMWLADYGWSADGGWTGIEAAHVQCYGDTPLTRAVATAPDLCTLLERVTAIAPREASGLTNYLWSIDPKTPPPALLKNHPGLARRLAALANRYLRELNELLDRDLARHEGEFRPWRDIVRPAQLEQLRPAFATLAAMYRQALRDLDPRTAAAPWTVTGLRHMEQLVRVIHESADLPTCISQLRALPWPGVDALCGSLDAILARRTETARIATLPTWLGFAAQIEERVWRAVDQPFPAGWSVRRLCEIHCESVTPRPDEAGLTGAERAWRMVQSLGAFAARVAGARSLLDLTTVVEEAPLVRLSTDGGRREDVADGLRRIATRGHGYGWYGPESFGISGHSRALYQQQPRHEPTAVEQREQQLRADIAHSHTELLERVQALANTGGRIGVHSAAAVRALVADLLAGEFVTLLEIPTALRLAIESHLRNVIAVARSLHPDVMSPEAGRNPLTQEWLTDNLSAQYRLARLALDGWIAKGRLPPPSISLHRQARDFARTHLGWDTAATESFDTIVNGVRQWFEDPNYQKGADTFWRTADPQDKRLARELYFHQQLYREVDRATAYQLWAWMGEQGCLGECGVVRSPRLKPNRRYIARGDLFAVAPTVDGELEAHTHPQFLMYTDREGRQGVAGVTIALNGMPLLPSPSTHPILPSEGDLDCTHGVAKLRRMTAEQSDRPTAWNPRVTHAVLQEHGGTLIVYDATRRHFDLYFARNPANPGDEEWTIQQARLEAWAREPAGPNNYRRPFTIAFHGIAFADVVARRFPAERARPRSGGA